MVNQDGSKIRTKSQRFENTEKSESPPLSIKTQRLSEKFVNPKEMKIVEKINLVDTKTLKKEDKTVTVIQSKVNVE